jgi:lipopolysaccharide export system protein LptA
MRPLPRRTLAVVAAAALLVTALGQGATTTTTVTVERGERALLVEQRALAVDGARSILGNERCEPGLRVTLFYGPPPGYVQTTVDETTLTSTIAIVRVPIEGDGEETLELFGGRATISRAGCLEEVDDEDAERVVLAQGRTTVRGTRFFLDQGTDVAEMTGPVELERRNADGGVALEATARELSFDIASERSTLAGDVVVRSEERVSSADRLELDEEAGLAFLTGAPAVSRRGEDEVRGQTLRYDLETDDVVVTGGVRGTFTVDLE